MARRILNRKDLRADYEAAERRKGEEEDELEEEETDDEEADEEEDGGAATVSNEEDELTEERPKKRKPAKPRARRPAKVPRLKVVWGVFNNANQRVAVFDYPRRQEAEDLAAKLKADKKTTHFVQAVKEPLEEKA